MQDLFRGYAVFLLLLQLIYGLTSFTRSVTNQPVRNDHACIRAKDAGLTIRKCSGH